MTPELSVAGQRPQTDLFVDEFPDFSLVLGGPIFQLLRKVRMGGDHLELLYRRVLFAAAITWLPLFLLDLFGNSSESAAGLTFLHDIEVHVRFLVALPVLIAAELMVHSRLTPIVHRFDERHIVVAEDRLRFKSAVDSAIRLRNSVAAELVLLACSYGLGLWLWNDRVVMNVDTWYARAGGRWALTTAGFWYVFVSLPITQFILLRWYMRFFVWFRFLWRVSRLNLNLIPSHPDRCAGLSFLGKTSYAFSPILFAQGAMLAGLVATRVLYRGETLTSFKLQIGGFVAFFVVAVLGPLVMFTPRMAAAKRKGLADYGLLAQRYVERFQHAWIAGGSSRQDELLGSADIQSLADLGNSYGMVRDMRLVPFGLDDITRMAAVTATPFVPLLLTIWSPEEVILRIFQIVF
jgi:hypothetical protein